MASAPRYKVYRDREYIGCCKYAEDAAWLCHLQGETGTVRAGHRRVVWMYADDPEFDSVDKAADLIRTREV